MRTIDRASVFKRDYRREVKGSHRTTLDNDLMPVLIALETDQPLDAKYRDHDLSGDWAGYFATAKLNDIEPASWLKDTLEKLPTWPNSRIDELLPFWQKA